MDQYKFIKAENAGDLERFFPVMKELRTNLSFDNFLNTYEKAHLHDGYEILGVEAENKIIAVMGYRILYDFVHGKHIYIDDLVTTEKFRSRGIGALFLKHAEKIAKDHNCSGLRLCTGVENESGKKFYESQQWKMRAVVYKKKIG
ncbi:MAG: GNAT family N-acetyltransferase [Bacteriovorax sp.]